MKSQMGQDQADDIFLVINVNIQYVNAIKLSQLLLECSKKIIYPGFTLNIAKYKPEPDEIFFVLAHHLGNLVHSGKQIGPIWSLSHKS